MEDYFRLPAGSLPIDLQSGSSPSLGFFRFGSAICYGHAGLDARHDPQPPLPDAMNDVSLENGRIALPFSPAEVIDNLRLERYPGSGSGNKSLKHLYYRVRPFTNRFVRTQIQRFAAGNRQPSGFPSWPVDTTVEDICETVLLLSLKAQQLERLPFIWFWPKHVQATVLMTHDVENASGRDFCQQLMSLDEAYGIPASFQIVPESRYKVTSEFLRSIRDRGFEVGVQDLNHDGMLFENREEFERRAKRINAYAAQFEAAGFRSAVLYRKPDWFSALSFSYDMSSPTVAPFDPQRGGCCTVTPYFISDMLEIPVTTAQDYTLFYILRHKSIDLWKNQIQCILKKHGLVSFIVHPDYVLEESQRKLYESVLHHLAELRDATPLWFALPREVDAWWRARSKMRLVRKNGSWRIEGDRAEEATVAFARVIDDKLAYEMVSSAVA